MVLRSSARKQQSNIQIAVSHYHRQVIDKNFYSFSEGDSERDHTVAVGRETLILYLKVWCIDSQYAVFTHLKSNIIVFNVFIHQSWFDIVYVPTLDNFIGVFARGY